MDTIATRIAAAALVAGAVASAYFSLVVSPPQRAANIAAAEACIEAKGVDCDDIDLQILKGNKPLLNQLAEVGVK